MPWRESLDEMVWIYTYEGIVNVLKKDVDVERRQPKRRFMDVSNKKVNLKKSINK